MATQERSGQPTQYHDIGSRIRKLPVIRRVAEAWQYLESQADEVSQSLPYRLGHEVATEFAAAVLIKHHFPNPRSPVELDAARYMNNMKHLFGQEYSKKAGADSAQSIRRIAGGAIEELVWHSRRNPGLVSFILRSVAGSTVRLGVLGSNAVSDRQINQSWVDDFNNMMELFSMGANEEHITPQLFTAELRQFMGKSPAE